MDDCLVKLTIIILVVETIILVDVTTYIIHYIIDVTWGHNVLNLLLLTTFLRVFIIDLVLAEEINQVSLVRFECNLTLELINTKLFDDLKDVNFFI